MISNMATKISSIVRPVKKDHIDAPEPVLSKIGEIEEYSELAYDDDHARAVVKIPDGRVSKVQRRYCEFGVNLNDIIDDDNRVVVRVQTAI